MSILVLRPGLFHRIKANNRKDLFALEIENLYIRSNLIRMLNNYGKDKKDYESLRFTFKKSLSFSFSKITPFFY